jgi:hypothetical protein
MSSEKSCPELVRIAFWTVPTNVVAATFSRYEPNQALMGRDGEVHSHPKSYTYNCPRAVGGYPDGMAHISPEVFRPLVESMSRRVAALCRTREGHTRY